MTYPPKPPLDSDDAYRRGWEDAVKKVDEELRKLQMVEPQYVAAINVCRQRIQKRVVKP